MLSDYFPENCVNLFFLYFSLILFHSSNFLNLKYLQLALHWSIIGLCLRNPPIPDHCKGVPADYQPRGFFVQQRLTASLPRLPAKLLWRQSWAAFPASRLWDSPAMIKPCKGNTWKTEEEEKDHFSLLFLSSIHPLVAVLLFVKFLQV